MAGIKKKYSVSEAFWCIILLFGIFNWIAYYYIGLRANYKNWIRIGHFYLFLFLLIFVLPFIGFSDFLIPIYSTIIIIGYIFGLGYGIIITNSYLQRLGLLYDIKNLNLEIDNVNQIKNYKLDAIIKEYTPVSTVSKDETVSAVETHYSTYSSHTTYSTNETEKPKMKSESKNHTPKQKKIEKIDINTSDEDKLSELPGINLILAKKIISERKVRNGFKNIDELEEFLNLQPHIANELKNFTTFSTINNEEKKSDTENKRIIDL